MEDAQKYIKKGERERGRDRNRLLSFQSRLLYVAITNNTVRNVQNIGILQSHLQTFVELRSEKKHETSIVKYIDGTSKGLLLINIVP